MPTPLTKPLDFVDVFLIMAGVVFFGGVVLILAFVTIPDKNMQLFTVVVSFISGSWLGAIIGNRFGSSKGSDAKSDVLNTLATKAAE